MSWAETDVSTGAFLASLCKVISNQGEGITHCKQC